jgi:putative peptidoglycan lipid II flippase
VGILLVGRPRLSFERSAPVREFARLTLASVGGGAVVRVNPVIDQLMAGFAGVVGGGTLLRYSSDVATVPTSLLQAALLPVLLSHVAESVANGEHAVVRRTTHRALAAVVLVLLAATALLWAARHPLLRLVYLRGAMDAESVAQMAEIFPYHLVGLAPFGVLLVLARTHTALKNNRIMVSMGVLNATLNAALNLVLLPVLGLAGIALATSVVSAVVATVFYLRLPRSVRRIS